MNCFSRHPQRDHSDLRTGYTHPCRGAHLFFRHSHAAMQKRFVQLADVDGMPKAFLHGNPHLANYAKTTRGAAMVDFDRSRFGPFGYDISRFLVSMSLRRGDETETDLLHPGVVDSFRRGYLLGNTAPSRPYEEMRELRTRKAKGWQLDLVRYLEKGRKWGGRLKDYGIDPRQPRLRKLFESYLQSRGEIELAERYHISAAGEVAGSMGKMHTLLLLVPDDEEALETRLIDVKEIYDEPDDEHFTNPYAHNGQRMVLAGELHAPGWEFNPGWATVDGVEYWVRGIPRQNEKLRKRLCAIQQIDLCFAVGSQLGRAHALSALGVDARQLLDCFELIYDELVDVAGEMRAELSSAHHEYLAAAECWSH